jgi:hypothetical protein
MSTLRCATLALVSALASNPAIALEGFSTCHAAGTTVTSISGFDTRAAKMTSVMTLPDAMEACHRNNDLNGAALAACADNLMRNGDAEIGEVTVWANCEKATLTVEYFPVHASTYYRGPGSKHVERYKFPVIPSCANDNSAAIAAFKNLCPSYEGKLELDQ